ncbi:MAG: hypothetical protein M1833_005898 [Piccolia ochrophora]|nr:MAG: hypothetical protein M1833_005898 [Piccolia ochrophora]
MPLPSPILLTADSAHTPPPIPTTCKAIDTDALPGGFERGIITALSGGAGTGKTLIALHALTTLLLTDPRAEAAVVDTTGSFDVGRLRGVVMARVMVGAGGDGNAGHSGEERERIVGNVLDRVKIMRVWDMVGLMEAVGEVREGLERRGSGKGRSEVVAGSQGEDEDEEMVEEEEEAVETLPERVGVIVIDTITNVVAPVMSKSQVQGHALLITFARSLSLLTAHHSLLTLLINNVVSTTPRRQNPPHAPSTDASIFASTHGKPALGRSFSYCVDTHVMLSKVARGREDAEMAVEVGKGKGKVGWREVGVCEVLEQRFGPGKGRWGCFVVEVGCCVVGFDWG